jgi:hypothetical protein
VAAAAPRDDAEARARMGVEPRLRAVEFYDVEMSVDAHLRAYDLVAARAGRRRRPGRTRL